MCSPDVITEAMTAHIAGFQAEHKRVSTSPFGPEDEIMNLITAESRQKIMQHANFERVYDLSVDYFVGMPGWVAGGDPNFQMWMTHTPAPSRQQPRSKRPRE